MHLFIHPFGTRSVLNNFNSIFNSVVFISRVVWDEEEEGEAEGKKRSSLHSHTCGERLLYFSDLVQNSPSYETWHHNEAALRSLLVVTGGSPRERRPRLPRARRASENAAVRQRCSTVDCAAAWLWSWPVHHRGSLQAAVCAAVTLTALSSVNHRSMETSLPCS